MTEESRGQVDTSAAEIYEQFFLPALFAQWPAHVIRRSGMAAGDRVLDVACGTGVLARAAEKQVGRSGAVVGLDLNDAMLAVAARQTPEVEWRKGRAESLPFDGASFDCVVSQFGLMFFEDRRAALKDCAGDSLVAIVNATFAENEATDHGAALAAHDAFPSATNVSFVSNTARWGGAVVSNGASRVRLSQASFFDNRAELGGGLYTQATASSILLNSLLWGSAGAGPDAYDLGTASQIDHVGASQVLAGTANLVLPGDPFDLVQPGARLYLNQDLTAQWSALNAGSVAVADDPEVGFAALGLSPWSALTTAADGRLDADAVDLGRHYAPNLVAIQSFDASASTLAWSTIGAERCAIFNDADATFFYADSDRLPSGGEPHAYPGSTEFTLVCFGPEGEPSVAFARVPQGF